MPALGQGGLDQVDEHRERNDRADDCHRTTVVNAANAEAVMHVERLLRSD